MPLVLDLRITHKRFGSSSDPSINGHLHYPNDLDRPLNETVNDKIPAYLADYNNRPSNAISFTSDITSTSGRVHSELVLLLFLQSHRETDRFFAASGVQLVEPTTLQLPPLGVLLTVQGKSGQLDKILTKTEALRMNLNLLTLSLYLGVPVPHTTQCMRDV